MPLKGLLNWNINSQRFVFEEIFFWRKNNLTKVWSCRFVLDEVERFKRCLFAHPLYLSLTLQIYWKLINLLKKYYKCICNVISNGFYYVRPHLSNMFLFTTCVYKRRCTIVVGNTKHLSTKPQTSRTWCKDWFNGC